MLIGEKKMVTDVGGTKPKPYIKVFILIVHPLMQVLVWLPVVPSEL